MRKDKSLACGPTPWYALYILSLGHQQKVGARPPYRYEGRFLYNDTEAGSAVPYRNVLVRLMPCFSLHNLIY